MLRPIVSFCLRRGIKYRDFSEIAKHVYLKVAKLSLAKPEVQSSVSRLAVMTGLQRPDVVRLSKIEEPVTSTSDFIARLIGAWGQSRKYTTREGKPRDLTTKGNNSEFAALVRSISTDLNPHTVRFELERSGLAEAASNGRLALKRKEYFTSGMPAETLLLGASDVRDLLQAVEENSILSNKTPHLHAKTEYDNVPDEALYEIREWFLREGTLLHARAREFLSKYDRDINPQAKGETGRNRVAIGTFSFIESNPQPVEVVPYRHVNSKKSGTAR